MYINFITMIIDIIIIQFMIWEILSVGLLTMKIKKVIKMLLIGGINENRNNQYQQVHLMIKLRKLKLKFLVSPGMVKHS